MRVGSLRVAFFVLLLGAALAAVMFLAPDLVRQRAFDPLPVDEEVEPAPIHRVGALGRIEPHHGVIQVAGPPRPAVVIQELLVEEGDAVLRDQPVAVLAGVEVQRAEVARLRAELGNTKRELERKRGLRNRGVLSDSDWEFARLARAVAGAELARAEAELALLTVRSPIDGRVLRIHARGGERVGADGVADLGETQAMYAVAEVYETDIGRVRVGAHARITSPALPRPLAGTVERVGLEIGKQDVLSTDPVADVDTRVFEVEIRLEESELAARFTNLRVDVVLEP